MKHWLPLLLMFLFFLPYHLVSQEHQWIEAEGLASMAEMNQQQARTAALNEARAEAVRLIAGVRIQNESIRIQSETSRDKKVSLLHDFFASVNREVAFGHVVDEVIISEKVITLSASAGTPPQLYYQIKIQAKVVLDKGERDSDFQIKLRTNKEIYKENENMTIDLEVSQDCYIYVFNILANDSLIVLFPNVYFQDNHLKADSILHLMPVGFTFQVTLLPGDQRANEFVYAVATKKRYEFATLWRDESIDFRTIATQSFAFIELPRWLSNIPADKRTDKIVHYEVYSPRY